MAENVNGEYEPIEEPNKGNPVLCYVDGCWAYFTTRALSEQWGDDWNDAPYEHNAGEPYLPYQSAGVSDGKGGWCKKTQYDGDRPGWSIVRLAWHGDLEAPCSGHLNSTYSVQDINAGRAPWLQSPQYTSRRIVIEAGSTIAVFVQKVRDAGGNVYTALAEFEKEVGKAQ